MSTDDEKGQPEPERVSGLFRAKQTFSFFVKGVPYMVFKGDIVRNSDPVVKRRGELFEPVDLKIRDFSEIIHPTAGREVAGTQKQQPEPEPEERPETDGEGGAEATSTPDVASSPDQAGETQASETGS